MSIIDGLTSVKLQGGGNTSRLSFVFEDRSGCLKGVTLRRLASASPPPPFGPPIEARSAIFKVGSGQRLGVLDPDPPIDDPSLSTQAPTEIMSSALLASTFTIELDQRGISPDFFQTENNIRFAEPEELVATNLFVGGERAAAGKVRQSLDFLSWNGLRIYPLLRLERSRQDMQHSKGQLRNGGVVKTESGALVGVIASISADATYYSLIPMSSITELHRLTFARLQQSFTGEVKKQSIDLPSRGAHIQYLSPRLAELVGAS
jgi:hypothetical protein